jgi:hypothetical protein
MKINKQIFGIIDILFGTWSVSMRAQARFIPLEAVTGFAALI